MFVAVYQADGPGGGQEGAPGRVFLCEQQLCLLPTVVSTSPPVTAATGSRQDPGQRADRLLIAWATASLLSGKTFLADKIFIKPF